MKVNKSQRRPKKWMNICIEGIRFSMAWRVIEKSATKKELQDFVNKWHRKNKELDWTYSNTQQRVRIDCSLRWYRDVWRKRYSESLLQHDGLFQVSRKINRYNWKKAAELGGHNMWRESVWPKKGDFLILAKTDELGNLYFLLNNQQGLSDGVEIVVPRNNHVIDSIVPVGPLIT